MLRFTRRAAAPQLPLVVGAGQVGSHLLAALAAEGCRRVKVLDARPRPSEKAAASGCELEYTWHRLGQDRPGLLANVLKDVDCVFTTVTSDVQNSTKEDFMKVNVEGMKELLAACEEAKVPKFVHVSSMAVTDHFRPSVDGTEEDSLPPLEEYRSAYDLSKRLGEDAVLGANSAGLATTSLRAGGVLAGPEDYCFRNFWERPGNIVTLEGTQPLDFIAVQDLCRATLLAADRLDSPMVAGQAFFITKGEAVRSEWMAEVVGEILGWPVTKLPEIAQTCIGTGMKLSYKAKQLLGQPVPGIAPHDFMQLPRVTKTFDNSKAQHVLDYKSEVGIEDAIRQIVAEWQASQGQGA